MKNYLKILTVILPLLIAASVHAETISSVTLSSFSSRLGMSWHPDFTIDSDPATFWMTTKTDAAPYIIYQMGTEALSVGKLTITNVPSATSRALDSANISYCADDSGNYTLLGTFSVDHTNASETAIDLGGITAKYIKIEPLTNYYGGVVYTIADNPLDGSANWIVGFAEIVFESPQGFADAGEDISVYDADDNAEEPVAFDGSASDFPDGSILSYSWSVDGSEIATGISPTVTLAVGEYEVLLTCQLSDGTSDTDIVNVSVVGTPQSFASAGDDITVTDSDESGFETVTLDGSNSAWSTTTWDWYEGETLLGSGQTLDVSLAVGVHTITLQCADHSGHSDSDEVIVTVLDGSPQPPVADAGLDRTVENRTGGAGEPVQLNASDSVDYDGTIASFVWSEGDSDIATGESPTVTLSIGTHTITLTVTDDDGMSDTDTVEITVIEYSGPGGNAPWVGAWEADNLFDEITAEDMEIIRSKNVLFASRSFGLNVTDGLTRMRNINPMYDLNKTGGYNVRVEGFDALPVDIFDDYNFVQFLASAWPLVDRLEELDWLIRNRYHDQLDAALVFTARQDPTMFSTYKAIMDSLRLDFPGITFIYVTGGFYPIEEYADNAASHAFNQLFIPEYQGAQPVYDLASVLSTHADGTPCVNSSGIPYMCLEFNINGDNTHPNSDFSEERMGKAMLLILKEIFCENEPEPKPGDIDGDDDVDIFDFLILKSNFGTETGAEWSDGDLDGNGSVNIFDFLILKANFGA